MCYFYIHIMYLWFGYANKYIKLDDRLYSAIEKITYRCGRVGLHFNWFEKQIWFGFICFGFFRSSCPIPKKKQIWFMNILSWNFQLQDIFPPGRYFDDFICSSGIFRFFFNFTYLLRFHTVLQNQLHILPFACQKTN